MRRITALVFPFLVSWMFFVYLAFAAPNTYKIGVIAPLSGPSASLGTYIRNGIDLAYSELDPTIQSQIELIYEDDGWQASKSVAAFHKLSTQDNIDALATSLRSKITPVRLERIRQPVISGSLSPRR